MHNRKFAFARASYWLIITSFNLGLAERRVQGPTFSDRNVQLGFYPFVAARARVEIKFEL